MRRGSRKRSERKTRYFFVVVHTRCDVAVIGWRGRSPPVLPPRSFSVHPVVGVRSVALTASSRKLRRSRARARATCSARRHRAEGHRPWGGRGARARGPAARSTFGFVPAAVVGGQAGWFSQWRRIKYGRHAAARRAPLRILRVSGRPATVRRRRADIRFSSLDCAVRGFTRSFSR